MANIHLERQHQLGLSKARKVAWQWAEEVEKEFQMDCTVEEGDDEDIVLFTRSGVNGVLTVTAQTFVLDAKLGLLLGAFAATIQSQIEHRLDALLGDEGKGAKATKATKAAATTSAKAKPAADKKPAKR
jgi:putative polyhydroxyalkanoate system protein